MASAWTKANKITPIGLVVNYLIRQRRTVTLSSGAKTRKREESCVALSQSQLRKDAGSTHRPTGLIAQQFAPRLSAKVRSTNLHFRLANITKQTCRR